MDLDWILPFCRISPTQLHHLKGVFIPILLWEIWIIRNAVVFQSQSFRCEVVVQKAYTKTTKYIATLVPSSSANYHSVVKHIEWSYPPAGYHKLNTDGAANEFLDVGIGGVIRDDAGKFIVAFAEYIYKNGSAIRQGLQIAEALNIQNMEVSSDSVYITNLCNQEGAVPWYFANILNDIFPLAKNC
ncbi:uncharacterized protein LOC113315527 [Papaver somniferum]|uniref:uncharacterized protein LOC113315527 n=1 Tax=Papaver somniferum TaxID=3469 RepID=UPI000E6F4792|nr:uncharacterized protein LOC113315527 [Papaver somniferum]